jgi:ATP-dependent protease HslVU (ClpYQ) peptidase subunit
MMTGKKLFKKRIGRKEHLLGFAGGVSYAMSYIEWYGSGKPLPDELRNVPEDYGFSVLIVIGHKLYEADGIGRPLEVEAKFHAIGSGAYAALGAMHHGASAAQAARIACKIEQECGLPIQTLSLPIIMAPVRV